MTPIASDVDELRELDEGTRDAWRTYRESLRDLSAAEYERAEPESWTALQEQLRRLERRRQALVGLAPRALN
jgi:hypothetical protein